jgi:membrane associated rhomboid family serine protease
MLNRRTLDLLVPIAYVIAIMIAVFFGRGSAVAATAAIGALVVGAYYAALRQNLKQ